MKKRLTAMITVIAMTALGMFTAGAAETYAGTPYGGTAPVISATQATVVEAENFDDGGDGVAYNLAQGEYSESGYRIRQIAGFKGFSFRVGDWFKYTVNAEQDGWYKTVINSVSYSAMSVSVEVNGEKYIENVKMTNQVSGNYNPKDTTLGYIYLDEGVNVITLSGSTPTGDWCYLNKFTLSDRVDIPPSTPYKENKILKTGTSKIEFEDYDNGGEGVAYHSTRTSKATLYRTDEYVAISGLTGARAVSLTTNEWLKFTVDVEETGDYKLDMNAWLHGKTMKVNVYVDDAKILNNKVLTNVGEATGYVPTMQEKVGYIPLKKGTNVIKIENPGEYFYPDYFRLTKVAETIPYDETLAFLGDPDFKIEAEHFDIGGKGVAYDSSRTNVDTSYRINEFVGIAALTGSKGVSTVNGEWFNYTFAAMGGVYNMNLNAVVLNADAVINVYVNGEKVISAKKLAKFPTQVFKSEAYDLGTLTLEPGNNTIKIERVSGTSMYYDYFSFTQANNSLELTQNENTYTANATLVNLDGEEKTSYVIAASYIGTKLEKIEVTPVTVESETYKNDSASVTISDNTTTVKAFAWETASGSGEPICKTITVKAAE